jgi:hypothetical protein
MASIVAGCYTFIPLINSQLQLSGEVYQMWSGFPSNAHTSAHDSLRLLTCHVISQDDLSSYLFSLLLLAFFKSLLALHHIHHAMMDGIKLFIGRLKLLIELGINQLSNCSSNWSLSAIE